MVDKKKIDIREFAQDVERMCDFFLNKIEVKDGSEDVRTLQEIKDTAADLQFEINDAQGYFAIDGLNAFMRGG